MSLKAKLEAVIYAAEEPVTLAQLAAFLPPTPWSGRRSRKLPQRWLPQAQEPASAENTVDRLLAGDAASGSSSRWPALKSREPRTSGESPEHGSDARA